MAVGAAGDADGCGLGAMTGIPVGRAVTGTVRAPPDPVTISTGTLSQTEPLSTIAAFTT